ncbi:sugar phosphate nucleotidyltransferase [Blattabacterium cuenoti]|uniref:sugar phosphate nucleotidyltransferase n=1 Tax=Blattabacterium cuenoti TaxID=1653831 RepID=UPI00163CBA2F|nr:sugar phosphate nucleotidyltransferase [Blattabacterium cuenoti]
MKIIIPMAGKGTRLHPHTLKTPKPFFPIVGKTILKRLLENLSKLIKIFSIDEIVFIVSSNNNNGNYNIEKNLIKLSNEIGVHPIIYYQEKPLGTADALLKAKNSLIGPIIIIYSDTLFYNNNFENELDSKLDNIIWTKKVNNPNIFGVVKCNSLGLITHFIEKPNDYISNLAIIGIYYFKNSTLLKKELEYILDNNIKNEQGEYQLTSALENMRKKGIKFFSKQVNEWMDFGCKKTIISSNSKILSIEYSKKENKLIHKKSIIKNSLIINPCYIDENTIIKNSIIGPYVSIGKYTKIINSNIKQSIILDNTEINSVILHYSMIGNYCYYIEKIKELNLGDYSTSR